MSVRRNTSKAARIRFCAAKIDIVCLGNGRLQTVPVSPIIPPVVGNLYRIPSASNDDSASEIMMPIFASSLLRLNACVSRFSRLITTEFPSAPPNAGNLDLLEWVLRDRRAADRACSHALRPLHNSDNTKHQHELATFRETPAPYARRLPTPEQSRTTATAIDRARSEKNILAKARRFFHWQRRRPQTGDRFPQRLAFTNTTTTAARPRTAAAT